MNTTRFSVVLVLHCLAFLALKGNTMGGTWGAGPSARSSSRRSDDRIFSAPQAHFLLIRASFK